MTTAPTTNHRMDALDGVRTIAVFLVILFHVQAPFMAAGYIGVDIFFVLSGYLITAGLMREAAKTGRIRLGNFWLRRFKRLMPAAMLTLLAVTAWMLAAMPATDMPAVSTDLWWTLLYVANWRLMGAHSYFADVGTPSPLLHMWSLAVEEQFYVAWPLLVFAALLVALAVARSRGRDANTLLGWVAGSLALTLVLASAFLMAWKFGAWPTDRLYMGTDTKAFEPLLGALAAIVLTNPRVRDALARRHAWLSAAGVVGMVALFGFLDGPADFYFRWGALAFCCFALLGIVGLVLSDGRGPLAAALSLAPVAYLGRISYGLYLWHWPIAVAIIHDRESFQPGRAAAVVALTIGAAALSYHLVEVPVRTREWFTASRSAVIAAASVAVMLVTVSFGGGTPLSPALFRLTGSSELSPTTMLVVGDSVPQRLSPTLSDAADRRGVTLARATAGGCAPSGMTVVLDDKTDTDCQPTIAAQQTALAQFRPSVVLWWSRYELADMRVDGEVLRPDSERFWDQTRTNLASTAQRLMADGATLVFVRTDRIGVGIYSRCEPGDCHPFLDRLAHHDEYRQRWNAMIDEFVATTPNTRAITVDDLYCTDAANPCDDRHAGVLARSDGAHFDDPATMPVIAEAVLERALADR